MATIQIQIQMVTIQSFRENCMPLEGKLFMYPSNLQSEREKSAKDMAATDDPDSSGESSPSNQVPVGAKRKSTGILCY